MSEKVLVIVKDGQILIRHTIGVETACIVDGEDVDLPEDWANLGWKALHTVPVRLEHPQKPTPSSQIFQNQAQNRAPACPETQLAGVNTQVQHQDGPSQACLCCGAALGTKHSTGCADQNPLVIDGDIVQEWNCR